MASNTSNISESTPVRRGGRAISDEIRSRLIKAHETGLSYGQISELYDVKKDTVYRICSFATSATSTLNSFFHVLTITVPKVIRLEDL